MFQQQAEIEGASARAVHELCRTGQTRTGGWGAHQGLCQQAA